MQNEMLATAVSPAPIDPDIAELMPFINPDVIEAESIYDMIDEDMNYPDWR